MTIDFQNELRLPTDDFILHMKEIGKDRTAKAYSSLLRTFQRWLRDKKGMTIENVNTIVVDEYVSTVNSPMVVLTVIREYFKYRYMALPVGDPGISDAMQRYNQLKLIRPKKRPKKLKKIALTPEDLKLFFRVLRDKEASEELIAGLMVMFYFGARPGELAGYLATAKVSLQKREMFIDTEKTHVERYLAWHPRLDPYFKTWYAFVKKNGDKGLPYPGEWITKRLKQEMGDFRVISGVSVTSRTARRTFQTQMRLLGVPDITIRAVLGHTDTSMSDVYTDWTHFSPIIRTAMTSDHYMIKNGVI